MEEDTDHNVTPLVEFDWQVSVGLDPFSVGGVHHWSKTKQTQHHNTITLNEINA